MEKWLPMTHMRAITCFAESQVLHLKKLAGLITTCECVSVQTGMCYVFISGAWFIVGVKNKKVKKKGTPGPHHAGETQNVYEKKRCKDDVRELWTTSVFLFFFSNVQLWMHTDRKQRGEQTCGQPGSGSNRSASVYQPLPSPCLFSHSPFSKLLGVIALCGNLTPNTLTQTPPPHPLPASLACSQVVGIPTACSAMIWLMEFDFQRGSLKRVWLFGRARDETGGRRGSWEGGDAWRAEAESCQLDSGSAVSL